MTMAHFTTQLLPSRASNLGILHLNNPSSLNALTLEMIRSMTATLQQWSNTGIRATMMDAAPNERNGKIKPAFCAGGDVKAVYLAGKSNDDRALTANFFREEYKLNHMIATQQIPQVSLWDGVVMGGGVGLSIHGKYRVATENTLFAMPECKIGLFPDVGGSWWIPRLKKLYQSSRNGSGVCGVGNYLALTGARLKAQDLMYSGIATHYVKSERLEELKRALIESTQDDNSSSTDCVASVLMSFHDLTINTDEAFLSKHKQEIDAAFDGKETVEDIISALQSMDTSFAQSTLETLSQMSPTSLKVTLEGLKRASKLNNIGECLAMEYRIVQACMKEGSDFYEGIRAALVDKDGEPKWSPGSLEEVSSDIVESYFESLGDDELYFDNVTSKL